MPSATTHYGVQLLPFYSPPECYLRMMRILIVVVRRNAPARRIATSGCNLFATQMNIAGKIVRQQSRCGRCRDGSATGTAASNLRYKDAAGFRRPRAVDQFQQFAEIHHRHTMTNPLYHSHIVGVNRYAMPKSRWRSSNKLIICRE